MARCMLLALPTQVPQGVGDSKQPDQRKKEKSSHMHTSQLALIRAACCRLLPPAAGDPNAHVCGCACKQKQQKHKHLRPFTGLHL